MSDTTDRQPPPGAADELDDPRVTRALEEYLADVEAGRRPDREEFLARHAAVAGALAGCLDGLDFLTGSLARGADPGPPASAGGESPAEESLVGRLADEYTERLRSGECPDVEEYARRHPEVAGPLRGVLPALAALALAEREPPEETAPPEASAGRLGEYRLLREIGRGGMGVVYEAEQVSLGRRVALKVLPFAGTLDPRQLQRFHNEAQAAAHLNHPNIVPVYAVGSEGGLHYYAMQLIDGRTLADVVRERRRLAGLEGDEPATGEPSPGRTAPADGLPSADAPPAAPAPAADTAAGAANGASTKPSLRADDWRAVARLGVQAAEALDHAHQLGVVHRDVKPANLLVDARGNVWVTDFGLAQFQSNPGPTLTGDLVGTLRYMSPEQALAKRGVVDHRTDVYALGATLYELLTLRPALPGTERVELLHQIAFTEPVPPRRLNPALPVELETVVLKALAKAPEERYATAQELADDLNRLLEDRPIRARPPSVAQRLRRWGRRHKPLVVSLAISAGVLLAGGTAAAVGIAKRQHKAKQEAEGKLYHALMANAEGLRLAREPGYRKQILKDMHEAAGLDVPDRDPNDIRKAVLACLGDPLGLGRVPGGMIVVRGRRPPIPDAFAPVLRERRDREHPITAATPDGSFLGLADPGRHVTLYHKDGRRLAEKDLPLGAAYDLEFSRDGRFLVVGCEEGVTVWTTPDLGLHLSVRGGSVFSVAVHRSGRLLATAGRQVELWSLASNRPVTHFDPPEYGARVEFSADGKYLLAPGAHGAAAWPVTETPEKRSLDGHAGGVPCLAFSPDGTRLASVSKDRTLRLWDAATGELRRNGMGHKSVIEAVAFSPDGAVLATGDRGGVIGLWDGRTGAPLGGINSAPEPGALWRLQFSATGRYLAAVGGNGVAVWERQKIGEALTFFRIFHRPLTGTLDVALHPSEDQLVALTGDGNLFAYDFRQGTGPRRLAAHAQAQVRSLQFDATGKRLLFVCRDGKLALWDWDTDTLAQQTDEQAVHLALGPGGRWVAATTPSRTTVVYDLQSGAETLALPEESGDVWGLAWSPDGRRLAVSRSDGGVAVWDLEQVRARLAEFGIAVPSTAGGGAGPPPPG